jgi:hypothetical protein
MYYFDIIFYLSWTYLATLILGELILIDLPVVYGKNSNSKNDEIATAVEFYIGRKKKLFYKITPIFCLLQIIGIISNIVIHYSDSIISALTIIALSFVLVYVQTVKNVNVANSLPTNYDKPQALQSIFVAHLITMLILVINLMCFIFNF